MKKILVVLVFIQFSSKKEAAAQAGVPDTKSQFIAHLAGLYIRQDSKIQLNPDSTFRFFYSVDMYRGWAIGRWTAKRKRIILKTIPIYDTLRITNELLQTRDTLILSKDEKSDKIKEMNNELGYVFRLEQNQALCPTLMVYKNKKLYVIKNGKRQKKNIKNGYYIEPFKPWYIKKY